MHGEVPSDVVGEMRIGFLHTNDCSLDVGIAVRLAALGLADALDPVPQFKATAKLGEFLNQLPT